MIDFPLLSLLVWLPIAGGIALLVMDAMGNKACRQTALIVASCNLSAEPVAVYEF